MHVCVKRARPGRVLGGVRRRERKRGCGMPPGSSNPHVSSAGAFLGDQSTFTPTHQVFEAGQKVEGVGEELECLADPLRLVDVEG